MGERWAQDDARKKALIDEGASQIQKTNPAQKKELQGRRGVQGKFGEEALPYPGGRDLVERGAIPQRGGGGVEAVRGPTEKFPTKKNHFNP